MLIRARSRAILRRREWGLLAVLLLGMVAWLSVPGSLDRLNHLVQDAGTRLQSRPGHADIVIIAIDDRSIQAVGRWPWRRALHAQMLDEVSSQSPRAIGLDILFGEEDADYPGDDLLLARAMRDSGHVVLPVTRRSHGAGDTADLPLPLFTASVNQLGHVHVNVDSDGVARSLHLQEGPAAAWPHFSLAMQCADGVPLPVCGGTPKSGSGPWTQERPETMPFAAGTPPFTTYSYIDVLKGATPADAFRDKYVLVGATATGLGDMFAAPVSPQARRIPGVEMVAHVLNGQLSGIHIQPAPAGWNTAFNLLPVAIALLALLLLGPFAALMTSAALFLLTLAAAALAPAVLGWQLAPAAALAGLLLAYPLWSWRRLNAAAHFLRLEMQDLQKEGLSLQPGHDTIEGAFSGDFLDRRINAVEHATQQLRELHHFVSDSLQQLPSPNFVCDGDGLVTLVNAAAVRYIEAKGLPHPQGQPIAALLKDLVDSESGVPIVPENVAHMHHVPPQQEGRDAQGRSMLMLCKPFSAAASTGWLMTLVDLTDMRRALQQRDEALNFISHDIRAPNASILTLLEMQREYPDQMPSAELLPRIERYAQASLAMAESFVRLASAQSHSYRHAPLDLVAALEETVDDAWAAAQEHRVRVVIGDMPEAAPCHGDRALICRAIANVVNNAIKFSPAGGTVHCTLADQEGHWAISVRDEGPGIAPDVRDRLFQPFQRLHEGSHPRIGGIGLGLALVHTVVQRHGGRIDIESHVGLGTEFRLLLPKDAAPPGTPPISSSH